VQLVSPLWMSLVHIHDLTACLFVSCSAYMIDPSGMCIFKRSTMVKAVYNWACTSTATPSHLSPVQRPEWQLLCRPQMHRLNPAKKGATTAGAGLGRICLVLIETYRRQVLSSSPSATTWTSEKRPKHGSRSLPHLEDPIILSDSSKVVLMTSQYYKVGYVPYIFRTFLRIRRCC